ncbi:MAG: pirin family protein [Bacteroidota bacterium]|nr:pirin family protein [Bacteroidota bacterium]
MERKIIYRSFGSSHGFITRMISPNEIGELTKPFVFLDFINGTPAKGAGFGWHPHSGIATFTYQIEGGSHIEESTGNKVAFGPRDVEYLQAGSGAWHKGAPDTETPIKGFQLWIALPPELEQQEAKSRFLKKNEFEKVDNVIILLGDYKGHKSKIVPPNDMNYFEVTIEKDKAWNYTLPATHNILWIQVFEGSLNGNIKAKEGELIIFEEGNQDINFVTDSGVKFILGSAKKFEHNLFLGRSSVHTSQEALDKSLEKINEIYNDLAKQNKL